MENHVIMMAFYKRILCVFTIVLYINLSSPYFIKVQRKSKRQEVDLFIQKLLDSDKFDELADKIAMKAVQRINSYYVKEPRQKLRSGGIMEETQRTGPNKNGAQGSFVGDARLTTQALTSEEKKTTIISLKYKRFTRNVLDEDKHYISKVISTNRVEGRTGLTNRDKNMNTTKTEEVKVNDKSTNKKETIGSLRNDALSSGDSDDNKLLSKKESTHTIKTTTEKSKVDDEEFKTKNEVSSTKTTTTPAKYDDDSDDEFFTKKEPTDSPKTTQRLEDYNSNDENDNFNKRISQNVSVYEIGSANKVANEGNKYDDDSNEEIVRTEPDNKKTKHKKGQKEVKKGFSSFYLREDSEHEISKKSEDAIPTEDIQDESVRVETENRVTKDIGDADPEEEKERDNSDSNEGKLGNNKILVRREGNTLYAQNLDDYDDYRAQLEKDVIGSRTKVVAAF